MSSSVLVAACWIALAQGNPRSAPPPRPTVQGAAPKAISPPARFERFQTHLIDSEGGWKIVARRHRTEYWNVAFPPVILYPGLGHGGRVFESRPKLNIADFLARAGFDVWVIDPRGAGLSTRWSLLHEASVPIASSRRRRSPIPPGGFVTDDQRFEDFAMEDLVDRDIPHLVEEVTKRSGFPKVFWIGHEWGGLLALAYQQTHPESPIARLVLVEPPTADSASSRARWSEDLSHRLERRRRRARREPIVDGTALFHPFGGAPLVIPEPQQLSDNDEPAETLLEQLIEWTQTGVVRTVDNDRPFLADFSDVRIPVLILAAAADPRSSSFEQERLLERLGVGDKSLLVIDKASGFSLDSAAGQVLWGSSSRGEIYPLLSRWLAGQSVGKARISTK